MIRTCCSVFPESLATLFLLSRDSASNSGLSRSSVMHPIHYIVMSLLLASSLSCNDPILGVKSDQRICRESWIFKIKNSDI